MDEVLFHTVKNDWNMKLMYAEWNQNDEFNVFSTNSLLSQDNTGYHLCYFKPFTE